jgi:hypothetical protein
MICGPTEVRHAGLLVILSHVIVLNISPELRDTGVIEIIRYEWNLTVGRDEDLW